MAIGELAKRGGCENLEFDRGEVTFDAELNETYSGNGIPDAAELYLLDSVLKDASLNMSSSGGVTHWYTY